jgi:hypothetical protein
MSGPWTRRGESAPAAGASGDERRTASAAAGAVVGLPALQLGGLPILPIGLGAVALGLVAIGYLVVSNLLSSAQSSAEEELDREMAEDRDIRDVVDDIDEAIDHVSDDPEQLARDFTAPDSVEWGQKEATLDEGVTRTYYVDGWPDVASTNFLNSLFADTTLDVDVSMHLDPRSVDEARQELDALYGELTSEQMTDNSGGGVLASRDIERAREMVKTMRDLVSNNGRRVLDVSMYVTVRTDDMEDLRYADRQVKEALERDAGMVVRPAKWRQDRAMKCVAPTATDTLNKKRAMLGDAVAATFPFSSSTLIEPSGIYTGVNPRDGSPIMMDPWQRSNGYNRLTLGMIGGGKSFSSKQFILRAAMAKPGLDVVIIDPMGGFAGINLALNGDRIVVDGTEGINPMHIEPTPQEVIQKAGGQLDPFGNKLDDVQWFFDRFFHMRGESLDSRKWGVLDRAIQLAYSEKGINENLETHSNESPTIRDVIEILEDIANDPADSAATTSEIEVEMWGEMASSLLMSLEPFREGNSLSNLARPTDLVVGESSCTYVDMQQVSARDDTSGLMMQLLFSMLYQKMKNSEDEVMMVIDEAHKIMRDSEQLGFLEEVFRHSRHYDMSINLITQTPEEFYINDSAKAIADQCAIKQIHRVDSIDDEIAEEYMELSEVHREFIRDAETGAGEKDYSEALLEISDHGFLPLRIYATDEEAAIIDYEPGDEEADDLTSTGGLRVRRAVMEAQRMDVPVTHPELADDELVQAAQEATKDRAALSLPEGAFDGRPDPDPDEDAPEAGAETDGGRAATVESGADDATDETSADDDETAGGFEFQD